MLLNKMKEYNKRKLSYKALLYMDKMRVVVKDLENDIYDQLCTVNVCRAYEMGKNSKLIDYVIGIDLENDEYVFSYDWKGNCINGEFTVYSYYNGNLKEIKDV